ncbi:MAG: hypothetical protein WA146_14340, partial [Thiobacillus sp.]
MKAALPSEPAASPGDVRYSFPGAFPRTLFIVPVPPASLAFFLLFFRSGISTLFLADRLCRHPGTLNSATQFLISGGRRDASCACTLAVIPAPAIVVRHCALRIAALSAFRRPLPRLAGGRRT